MRGGREGLRDGQSSVGLSYSNSKSKSAVRLDCAGLFLVVLLVAGVLIVAITDDMVALVSAFHNVTAPSDHFFWGVKTIHSPLKSPPKNHSVTAPSGHILL